MFENGVKNIQAAAYNGARTVYHNLEMNVLGFWFFFECDFEVWHIIRGRVILEEYTVFIL